MIIFHKEKGVDNTLMKQATRIVYSFYLFLFFFVYIYIYIYRMDNNELLMIVLAFVVGYMVSGMMKQMCGGRLVEGNKQSGAYCNVDSDCQSKKCSRYFFCF